VEGDYNRLFEGSGPKFSCGIDKIHENLITAFNQRGINPPFP
jgi:hypothetical protein